MEVGTACLAQSVERKALNLVVVGSSPTVGVLCFGARWQRVVKDKHFPLPGSTS